MKKRRFSENLEFAGGRFQKGNQVGCPPIHTPFTQGERRRTKVARQRGGRYNAGMRVLIVSLIISVGLAAGQTITPAERQAILAYQLNMPRANSLITTGVALGKYRASIPDFQANPAKYLTMTLSESIASLEKDQKAMTILKQNGFAARDYMIGFTALSMAYTIASGSNAPDYVASPANVAFAKSNPQLLRELLAVLRVDTSKK